MQQDTKKQLEAHPEEYQDDFKLGISNSDILHIESVVLFENFQMFSICLPFYKLRATCIDL